MNEDWKPENDIYLIDNYYSEAEYLYDPVAYFLNPFTKDTTRYCEDEAGQNVIDPTTIPENFAESDCFSDPTVTAPFQPYDVKCVCANGFMLNEDGSECLPCSEIHEHCT